MRSDKMNSAKARLATGAAILAGALVGLTIGCSRSEAAPSKKADPTPAAAPATAPGGGASDPSPAASSKVDGKNFKLEALPQGDCKAGAECRVIIRLEALGEYHINKEYPYKFTAKADDVEFLGTDQAMKNVFSKANGDFKTEGETKATMTVKFKPAKAGQVALSGTYKMSVCSAQNCQLESQQLALNVPVK